MGWDGVCEFEELVDGHWLSLGRTEVQSLVYRVANSLHASFVKNHPDDRWDQDNCEFLWSDLVSASIDDLDNGNFRSPDDILERLSDANQFELVEALIDESRTIRVSCSIGC